MRKPYEIEGVIHRILPVQTFPSGFSKRTVVLDITDEGSNYKDYLCADFTKDGISKLDGFMQGNSVVLSFYVSSSESKTKPGSYFTNVRGIKIADAQGSANTRPTPGYSVPAPATPPPQADEELQDDLPF